jgi:hypothetical protein
MMNFKYKFVNLTPHVVVIQMPDGLKIKIKPSGSIARVSTEDIKLDKEINGIPCIHRKLTYEVEGLPEPRDNTYYIVSALVYYTLSGRDDILVPDTSSIQTKRGDIRVVKQFIIN